MSPRRAREGQRGQAIVLIAIMLAIVIGMAALAIDGSRAYALRRDLQAAIDDLQREQLHLRRGRSDAGCLTIALRAVDQDARRVDNLRCRDIARPEVANEGANGVFQQSRFMAGGEGLFQLVRKLARDLATAKSHTAQNVVLPKSNRRELCGPVGRDLPDRCGRP